MIQYDHLNSIFLRWPKCECMGGPFTKTTQGQRIELRGNMINTVRSKVSLGSSANPHGERNKYARIVRTGTQQRGNSERIYLPKQNVRGWMERSDGEQGIFKVITAECDRWRKFVHCKLVRDEISSVKVPQTGRTSTTHWQP